MVVVSTHHQGQTVKGRLQKACACSARRQPFPTCSCKRQTLRSRAGEPVDRLVDRSLVLFIMLVHKSYLTPRLNCVPVCRQMLRSVCTKVPQRWLSFCRGGGDGEGGGVSLSTVLPSLAMPMSSLPSFPTSPPLFRSLC